MKLAQFTPRRIARAIVRRLWHRCELLIFVCPAERISGLPNPRRCARDRWEDLNACDAGSYGDMSREQYVAHLDARRRIAGNHLYSVVEDGVLVHYGWLAARQERAPDEQIGLVFIPPRGSAALWDYFTHPIARGRGLYRDSLWQCMHDAVEIDGARQVFIYVYTDNPVSRHAIEKAGFEYYGSLVLERRFVRRRRYGVSVHTALDVRLLAGDSVAPVVRAPVASAVSVGH
jgi:RimJ/RimL family protein N-acetyltransferase